MGFERGRETDEEVQERRIGVVDAGGPIAGSGPEASGHVCQLAVRLEGMALEDDSLANLRKEAA